MATTLAEPPRLRIPEHVYLHNPDTQRCRRCPLPRRNRMHVDALADPTAAAQAEARRWAGDR